MASYEFGKALTNMETMDDLRDEILSLHRKMDYFSQNLNHHNVKTLYTEYCDIQSEGGETIIDGPLILMYSATDSTTLRLEMGYDSSEFVFRLFNNLGTPTVYIDSSGNAVFTGSILAAQITGSTITGGNISGSSISGAQITGSTISGAQITGSTITASQITASSIVGGYIYGSTIVGGQITGSCIATSENLYVGEQIMIGSTSVAPPVGTLRGVYFGSTENYLCQNSSQFMTLRSNLDMQIIANGAMSLLQNCSTEDFSIIQYNASGEACFPLICVSSGQKPSFGMVITNGYAYYGGSATTDILVKGTLWDNWVPSYTWTGGTPGAVTVNVARYRIFERNCWFKIDYTFKNKIGTPITNVTISLPRSGSTVFTQTFNCKINMNSTYGIEPQLCYGAGNGLINFIGFPSISTSTAQTSIFIEGMYETT